MDYLFFTLHSPHIVGIHRVCYYCCCYCCFYFLIWLVILWCLLNISGPYSPLLYSFGANSIMSRGSGSWLCTDWRNVWDIKFCRDFRDDFESSLILLYIFIMVVNIYIHIHIQLYTRFSYTMTLDFGNLWYFFHTSILVMFRISLNLL